MLSQRDDLKTIFNKYCEWQSHNNRGTQIGIYSIAVIGLAVALRRVRPFTKFTKPHDVPNSFIAKRREINGQVDRIEPNGAVLMINHSPIIPLPGINTKKKPLPVKIANVDINGLGINWLQSIVAGHEVTFVPLSKYSNYLLCEVNLTQKLIKNKQQTIDLGESLISIGFGKYEDRPLKVNDIMHRIYIDKLKYAEEKFIKREMGIKYYIEHTKALVLSTIRPIAFISKYSSMKLYNLIMTRAVREQSAKKMSKELSVNT